MTTEDHQHLFNTIFQQTPVSTQVFDVMGNTVMVNNAWEKLWNVSYKKIKGYNILNDHQLVETGVMKYIKKGFKGEQVQIPPIKYVPSKTIDVKEAVAYRWLSAIMYPIKDSKGQIKFIVLQHEDITQRKESEESIYRLASIVESSDDAIISKTLDGVVTSWNRGAEMLFGYTEKEAIGQNITFIIPPALYFEEAHIISQLKKGRRIKHFETIRMKKDGTQFPVSESISPIKDDTGTVIGASKIARDISAQKKSAQKLQENEERLRIALDAGNIGVWDWNLINDQLTWTEKVYELHGVDNKKQKITLDFFRSLIHPEDRKRLVEAISDSIKEKKQYSAEFRIITPQGKVRWLSTKAMTSYSADGKPVRMLGATSDITNQKNIDQMRNDFISIAAHELKTPLTSIRAYAQVLERKFNKANDIVAAGSIAKMNNQLNKLTNLIGDLLDITKIEAGKLYMSKETFNIDELVIEIVESMQLTTDEHNIIIKGTIGKEISADRERIGQVITNFISNAIKYSPRMKDIIIKVNIHSGMVRVCVQDFGNGISTDTQTKIFERFYRGSEEHDKTVPGLGLGLYISSEIIKRQNGKIWVESIPGKGSNFCFLLPIR